MMIPTPLTDALAKRLQWLDGEAYIAREILNNVEKGKRADNKNPVPVRKTLWQEHGVKLVSQLEKQGHVVVATALVDAVGRYPVTAPTGFYPPDELRDERRTIVNLQALLTGVELQGDQGKLTEPDAPKNKTVERAKWLATAMLLVQEHPDWSDAKIAREVGKHPSTLSRDKTYQVAAAMALGDKSNWQRGFIKVDPDSGQQDVEAVTRDDNESMEVDHDQPKPGDPVAGAYPSAKTYARDEWIYKNIHLNSCDTLSVKLNKKAKTEKWAIISSRNGLKDAADRHADYHKKEKRRFKKH